MRYIPSSKTDRQEMLADVREAFVQLEAAVSTARPSGCRPFVGADLHWVKSNVRMPRPALHAGFQSALAIVRRMSARPAAHNARIVARENS